MSVSVCGKCETFRLLLDSTYTLRMITCIRIYIFAQKNNDDDTVRETSIVKRIYEGATKAKKQHGNG